MMPGIEFFMSDDDLDETECQGMFEPRVFTEDVLKRKQVRKQLECDTCGAPSQLHKGMCGECIEKYAPKDFEDLD